MDRITVLCGQGEHDALSDGQVAAFDLYDDSARRDIRHYVLLNKSIKLMYEPWGWRNEWYADLMEIRWLEPKILELKDLYLDIIIEGEGPTYRMIDFDDLRGECQKPDAAVDDGLRPEHLAISCRR